MKRMLLIFLLWFLAPTFPACAQAAEAARVPPREVPPPRWEELTSDDAFWYSRERWKEDEEPVVVTRRAAPSYLNNLFRVLLYMGAAAGLAYLLYQGFRMRKRSGKLQAEAVPGEAEENWLHQDLAPAIAAATGRGDYRAAIRLQHLRLLAALHHKGYIRYDEGRTDRDYGDDLRDTSYERDWAQLSRLYAWTWYGKQPMPEPLYRQWAPQYEQLLGRVRP